MKKENENIHLHIIDEDYKANRNKKSLDISGKALELSDLQNDASVVKQLRKMHAGFAVSVEPEPPKSEEDLSRVEPQDKPMDSVDVSELFTSYQKLKTEEQELIDQKQNLLAMQTNLREKLTQEIYRKKKAVEDLHAEISTLQNTCREIQQELGLSTDN